jgi:hypothetical protein
MKRMGTSFILLVTVDRNVNTTLFARLHRIKAIASMTTHLLTEISLSGDGSRGRTSIAPPAGSVGMRAAVECPPFYPPQ